MAYTGRTADSMTTEVLARVRDPNGSMHPAAWVRDRLTDAQRFLNGILGLSINTAAINLNPGQNLYQMSVGIPNSIRVVGVRGSNSTRDLAQLPSIESLLIYGPRWARQVAPVVESWTTAGRDVLIVYPALRDGGGFSVWYVNLCAAFASGSTVSEFTVEQCGLIVTLTEALLYLRQRDLAACARAMDRLRTALTPELAADRLGLAPTQQKAAAGTQ